MGRLHEVRAALLECFQANSEPLTKAQALAWVGNAYPNNDFNLNTLQAQLYRSCPQNTSTSTAPKVLWYDKPTRTYRLRRDTDIFDNLPALAVADDTESKEAEEILGDSRFALEAHLRDYLARNLETLEKGLCLWSISPPSVEFSLAGRFIDILAKDKDSLPVVLELKLSKSYDRVIGQALLYRGLVAKHFGADRVRIMLVAGEVSDELKIACSGLNDVSLYEYAISFQTKQVTSIVEEGS